jgi:hypothetical protein
MGKEKNIKSESVLRQYLKDEYQIQNHRGTEEFAVEVLKTLKENLKAHQARTAACISNDDLRQRAKAFLSMAEHFVEYAERAN